MSKLVPALTALLAAGCMSCSTLNDSSPVNMNGLSSLNLEFDGFSSNEVKRIKESISLIPYNLPFSIKFEKKDFNNYYGSQFNGTTNGTYLVGLEDLEDYTSKYLRNKDEIRGVTQKYKYDPIENPVLDEIGGIYFDNLSKTQQKRIELIFARQDRHMSHGKEYIVAHPSFLSFCYNLDMGTYLNEDQETIKKLARGQFEEIFAFSVRNPYPTRDRFLNEKIKAVNSALEPYLIKDVNFGKSDN